jgi:creatinine amidohydrolase
MSAIELDRMTWPDVKAELDRGRATVVVAFGATEQHGPHLPLATDALIGDHLAWRIAERLDAFVAPTVRIGCSEHHLEFPGTLSVSEETFHALVADIVRSLAQGGFRRVVLLPTHGGNFKPLAAALEKLGPVEGIEIRALTDLGLLLTVAQLGVDEHDVPLGQGGLHAGEWETSMLLALHPDLVHMDRGEPGYTGDLQAALGAAFRSGVHAISPNGVVGDPARASAVHGKRYWEAVEEIASDAVNQP